MLLNASISFFSISSLFSLLHPSVLQLPSLHSPSVFPFPLLHLCSSPPTSPWSSYFHLLYPSLFSPILLTILSLFFLSLLSTFLPSFLFSLFTLFILSFSITLPSHTHPCHCYRPSLSLPSSTVSLLSSSLLTRPEPDRDLSFTPSQPIITLITLTNY